MTKPDIRKDEAPSAPTLEASAPKNALLRLLRGTYEVYT